jgi:starch phosphorylase
VFDESGERRVRMGHLAFLGAHRVNGVSALHTDLMRETVFRDLHALHPRQIVNKTNGISFRRWLFEANPAAARAARRRVGPHVRDDPDALRAVAPLAADPAFREAFARQRRTAKDALAALVRNARVWTSTRPPSSTSTSSASTSTSASSSTCCRRWPPYLAMRDAPGADPVPRVKIFSGKAAAGYRQAKLIIKLIHDVAAVGERRSHNARQARRRCSCDYQREPRGVHHSRGPTCRSRSPPPAWRRPARAT